MIHLASLFDWT